MIAVRVTLRPLAAGDLKMLHRWHGAPHLRPHVMQHDVSLAEIEAIFTPSLDADHIIRCRIAVVDGMPYGFLQWYPSFARPDCGAMRAGLDDSFSADYFIGNAAFLGLGLAERMLHAWSADMFSREPGALLCLAHDERNTHAIRASTAAGFRPRAPFRDGEKRGTVYTRGS